MPLGAFYLRHFSADFIICMCVFDFRQAQGSRVKIRSAGTRKCIRRYDRAGGVLGAVDAVAVARKRENVWLSSHRDSKAEQGFLCCARRNLAVPCHS
jgi:hypothetical protein